MKLAFWAFVSLYVIVLLVGATMLFAWFSLRAAQNRHNTIFTYLTLTFYAFLGGLFWPFWLPRYLWENRPSQYHSSSNDEEYKDE